MIENSLEKAKEICASCRPRASDQASRSLAFSATLPQQPLLRNLLKSSHFFPSVGRDFKVEIS